MSAPHPSERPAPRVLLAGGGTAGHVNPLLALADELTARDGRTVVRVLGTADGLEARLVPERGYELVTIPRVPFPRRPNLAALRFPGRYREAVALSRRCLEELRADVVVGFGGFVATPAYAAARSAGVPIVVHEQNARPGLANRLGARHAAVVALTFADTPLRARHGRTDVTGLPLRPPIAALVAERHDAARAAAARAGGLSALGLDPDRPVLLVTGGSLGALTVNRAVAAAAPALLASGAQVLHAAGAGKAEEVCTALEGVVGAERYHVVEYLGSIEQAYACADLALGRAGAGTVCELAALGLPGIYVPLPVGNGEQRRNAAGLVAAGGGLLVSDGDLTAGWIAAQVVPLLGDSTRLASMASAARAFGSGDGAARLADLVTSVIEEKRR